MEDVYIIVYRQSGLITFALVFKTREDAQLVIDLMTNKKLVQIRELQML